MEEMGDQESSYTLPLGLTNCSNFVPDQDWGEEETNYTVSNYSLVNCTCISDDCPELSSPSLFHFIILGIGVSVIAILGIIGNGLSAVVLSRPQMKSSVTCLLLGLTFCDTLLIFISIFTYSMQFLPPYINTEFLLKYSLIYYPQLAPYLYPISTTAQTGSVYLTLAVTIERYIAVCHSLQARSICTWRRARICVATVLTFSILYNLPRWFEVITIPSKVDEMLNLTTYKNDMSGLRRDRSYIKFYINWAYLIIMYLIPFSGLVVFNFAIYRQVRRANRERAQLSKLQKREMGLASMLLIVVVVFLMCNILPLVNNILESIWGMELDRLIALSNFLVVLNSSVNFVIYCTCGERFRRLLIRISRDFIRCRLRGGRRGSLASGFYRKSHYYRSQHGRNVDVYLIEFPTPERRIRPNAIPNRDVNPGGDFEEMSLGSMANHTCITTNGGMGNGTVIVDLSGEKPKNVRNYGRERNKTIPILHGGNNINRLPQNGQNGKTHIDRRVSSPAN